MSSFYSFQLCLSPKMICVFPVKVGFLWLQNMRRTTSAAGSFLIRSQFVHITPREIWNENESPPLSISFACSSHLHLLSLSLSSFGKIVGKFSPILLLWGERERERRSKNRVRSSPLIMKEKKGSRGQKSWRSFLKWFGAHLVFLPEIHERKGKQI